MNACEQALKKLSPRTPTPDLDRRIEGNCLLAQLESDLKKLCSVDPGPQCDRRIAKLCRPLWRWRLVMSILTTAAAVLLLAVYALPESTVETTAATHFVLGKADQASTQVPLSPSAFPEDLVTIHRIDRIISPLPTLYAEGDRLQSVEEIQVHRIHILNPNDGSSFEATIPIYCAHAVHSPTY